MMRMYFEFISWLKHHPVKGTLYFILIDTIGVLFFVPTTIFSLSSGFIFFQITADQRICIHQGILPGNAWQVCRFEGMKFCQQIGDC